MKFYIDHPASGGDVPFMRWLVFKYSALLGRIAWSFTWRARKYEHWALYGEWYDDEIPF